MQGMDRNASMTFRLPARTRAALERAAKEERRSLSSLLLVVLEDWLSARTKLAAPKAKRQPKRG